jgi:hypothetical protein
MNSLDEERRHGCSHLNHLQPDQVRSGIIITAQNVNHIHQHEYKDKEKEEKDVQIGIDILHRAVALEALYDSADSFPQPRCHLNTRTEMLDNLYNWAAQGTSRPILWLHGPAGAGKSAIMQTLCQRLKAADRLGGAFFFKRHHRTRGNAKVLFATLAYQLALNNRSLKTPIAQSAKNDPSDVGRHMGVQLHKLIVEPCQSLTSCPPSIILIDGLDECQDEGSQLEILRLIGGTAGHRFRFLIASRLEAHVRDLLEESPFSGILNSVNIEQSFNDVRTYFRNEFARIHRQHRHTMENTPTLWPAPEILEALIHKSSGYFAYASTVIRFIDDKDSRPTERLAAIQNLTSTDSDSPFAVLDELYTQILSGVPTRFRSTLCDILQCVVFKRGLRPVEIEQLLELQPGDCGLILRRLHSVVKIGSSHISAHHASFWDFLQDQRRSSIFHLGLETHRNVARGVIKTFSPYHTGFCEVGRDTWYAAFF